MEYIKIQTTILRYKETFDVICEPKTSFKEFKLDCKLLCPVPIDEFLIIFKGKIINENDSETWNEILKERKVKIMAQSYIEYNDPPEFKQQRAKENILRNLMTGRSSSHKATLILSRSGNDREKISETNFMSMLGSLSMMLMETRK